MSVLIHPLDSCPPYTHTPTALVIKWFQPLCLAHTYRYSHAYGSKHIPTHIDAHTHKQALCVCRGERQRCESLLCLCDLIWDTRTPPHCHTVNSNKVWIYSNSAVFPSLVCLSCSGDIWTPAALNKQHRPKKVSLSPLMETVIRFVTSERKTTSTGINPKLQPR